MSYTGSGVGDETSGPRERTAAAAVLNQDQNALLARQLHVAVDGLKEKEANEQKKRQSEDNRGRDANDGQKMPGTMTPLPHAKSRARVLLGWGAGLFISHIVSGYMQEMLFAVRGYTFGFYLTLGRYLVNALLAYLYLRLFDGSKLEQSVLSVESLVAHLRWLQTVLATKGIAGVVPIKLQRHAQRWLRGWALYMGMPKQKIDDQLAEHDDNDFEEDLEDGAEDGPQRGRSCEQPVGKEKVAQSASVTSISTEEIVESDVRSATSGRVPLKYYLLLSFLSVMALGLSTSSLAYLNYPTKVILRTSKLVLIMLFSRCILGKKHTNSEYGMAMAMVFGLVLFTLGDYQVTSSAADSTPSTSSGQVESVLTAEGDVDSFEWKTAKGVFLLFLSLLFESVNINLQKKILVGYERSSPAEMLFYNALFGSLVTFAILLGNGELYAAWDFAMLHPETHYYILCFAFFSTCGVVCAIMVLHNFDPMTIGIVVTGRKSITILTSFILIPKPISMHHVTGGMFVFVSLFVSAVWKSREGVNRPKDFAMD